MSRIRTRQRAAGVLLFFLYLAALGYFLFFAESFGRSSGGGYRYNLELFKEIRRFYEYRETVGTHAFLINIFGNVLAFMPFGFFLPIVRGKKCGVLTILVQGLLFSLAIETVQLVTRLGSFDVDDILLNTAGTLAGYICFRLFLTGLDRKGG